MIRAIVEFFLAFILIFFSVSNLSATTDYVISDANISAPILSVVTTDGDADNDDDGDSDGDTDGDGDGDSDQVPTVTQFDVFEIELETSSEHTAAESYSEVSVTATFVGPGDVEYRVPGYWDGDRLFRVRFAPPLIGDWEFTLASSDPELATYDGETAFRAVEPDEALLAENPNYRGFLRTSEDDRYLVYDDGTPFLWMGATIWDGNSVNMAWGLDPDDEGPNVAEFPYFIDDRKEKGFTLIQILVGEPNKDPGSRMTGINEGGALFLSRYDEINPENFQYLDRRIAYIADSGLIPCIFFHWGDAFNHMSQSELQDYYKYIVARYHAYNVVWTISGEYHYADNFAVIRELGEYLQGIDPAGHPISIHPGPASTNKSSNEDFNGESWIDVHMHQTWQQDEGALMEADYALSPATPIVNSEAGYDGIWGHDRSQVREDAWVVLMTGSGYTYGAHGLWAWNDGCCDDYVDPHPRWYDVIDLESSSDMERLVSFWSETQWWLTSPRDDLVNRGRCRAEEGRQYIVYLPDGGSVRVDLTEASGDLSVLWFNPSNGTRESASAVSAGGMTTLDSPFGGESALYLSR
jgi:hypothetical protein